MERKSDNVILFPKWKETLEQESLLALEQKEYEKALGKINKLLAYNYQKNEILTGKMICLMELNRYEEAQELCESLLKHKSDDYYHYLHIYLTILFQTNQFQLLMEQVESVLMDESVPPEMRDMFQQLYEMSKNMQHDIHLEQSHYLMEELSDAVNKKDYQKQWRLIEKLKHLKIKPTKELFSYLTTDEIHPVIKTSLFQWLQRSEVKESVDIQKENSHIAVEPANYPLLKDHTIMKQLTLLLSKQEQKNPTLYHLMKKLLYRYLYVWYPIFPDESELEQVATALRLLAEGYLQDEPDLDKQTDDITASYIRDIHLCETLYLSILDDSF